MTLRIGDKVRITPHYENSDEFDQTFEGHVEKILSDAEYAYGVNIGYSGNVRYYCREELELI